MTSGRPRRRTAPSGRTDPVEGRAVPGAMMGRDKGESDKSPSARPRDRTADRPQPEAESGPPCPAPSRPGRTSPCAAATPRSEGVLPGATPRLRKGAARAQHPALKASRGIAQATISAPGLGRSGVAWGNTPAPKGKLRAQRPRFGASRRCCPGQHPRLRGRSGARCGRAHFGPRRGRGWRCLGATLPSPKGCCGAQRPRFGAASRVCCPGQHPRSGARSVGCCPGQGTLAPKAEQARNTSAWGPRRGCGRPGQHPCSEGALRGATPSLRGARRGGAAPATPPGSGAAPGARARNIPVPGRRGCVAPGQHPRSVCCGVLAHSLWGASRVCCLGQHPRSGARSVARCPGATPRPGARCATPPLWGPLQGCAASGQHLSVWARSARRCPQHPCFGAASRGRERGPHPRSGEVLPRATGGIGRPRVRQRIRAFPQGLPRRWGRGCRSKIRGVCFAGSVPPEYMRWEVGKTAIRIETSDRSRFSGRNDRRDGTNPNPGGPRHRLAGTNPNFTAQPSRMGVSVVAHCAARRHSVGPRTDGRRGSRRATCRLERPSP